MWCEQPEDAGNFAIVYTSHRDSGLLDQSNARVIDRALEPFTKAKNPDVRAETHSHWAVGYVNGYAIRVFKRGAESPRHSAALPRVWPSRLANYPILDEEDYSNRTHEATLENIAESAWRLKDEYELPKDWQRRGLWLVVGQQRQRRRKR